MATTTLMDICVDKIVKQFSKKVHRTKSNPAHISLSSSLNNVYIGATLSLWNSHDNSTGREHNQCEHIKERLLYIPMESFNDLNLLSGNDISTIVKISRVCSDFAHSLPNS